jgi:Na+-translocating ferredoxin:NAD+ oxidoreductase subunit D
VSERASKVSRLPREEVEQRLEITSSPQFHDQASTPRIMWSVTACLLPASAWGVYVFGWYALAVLLVSVLASVATEWIIARAMSRRTLFDGSAVLTGILIGMNMPPEIPFHVPIVASIFAIGVVKWTFGGLGNNWMNPALAGRVFVFFSWTGEMTSWKMPFTLPVADGTSGATLLGALKSGVVSSGGDIGRPAAYLQRINYPRSVTDGNVTSWLNENVLEGLGITLPGGYIDPLLGNIPGCIGEVSALLLMVGAVYLFAKRIITWEIPASYFLSFAVLTWIFGGRVYGTGFFTGDVLFHILAGGFMLGIFFMATDMVTSPMTTKGMLIYGAGAGVLTFLIRFYGSFPEGVSLAILLMNIAAPIIDRYVKPTIYGTGSRQES